MSVVLITGSSSGFGKAGALAFARRGDRVYATVRSPVNKGVRIEFQTSYDTAGVSWRCSCEGV